MDITRRGVTRRSQHREHGELVMMTMAKALSSRDAEQQGGSKKQPGRSSDHDQTDWVAGEDVTNLGDPCSSPHQIYRTLTVLVTAPERKDL